MNAVLNRHGFMPLKPHRKQYGFKAFTWCQSHLFQVLTSCRSHSQALIIEEGDLGSIITLPFFFVNMVEKNAQFTWTDDEVELLVT